MVKFNVIIDCLHLFSISVVKEGKIDWSGEEFEVESIVDYGMESVIDCKLLFILRIFIVVDNVYTALQ